MSIYDLSLIIINNQSLDGIGLLGVYEYVHSLPVEACIGNGELEVVSLGGIKLIVNILLEDGLALGQLKVKSLWVPVLLVKVGNCGGRDGGVGDECT
jgi:hypothetical protein